MSTWRVPATLKNDIDAWIPTRYPNTTAAVIDLCRMGLRQLAQRGPERTVFGERFLILASRILPRERLGWQADFLQPGVPHVPLVLHSLAYKYGEGDQFTDDMHLTEVSLGGSALLLKEGLPMKWITDEHHPNTIGHPFLSNPIMRHPNRVTIEGSHSMMGLAGNFLVEVSRWDGRPIVGESMFDMRQTNTAEGPGDPSSMEGGHEGYPQRAW